MPPLFLASDHLEFLARNLNDRSQPCGTKIALQCGFIVSTSLSTRSETGEEHQLGFIAKYTDDGVLNHAFGDPANPGRILFVDSGTSGLTDQFRIYPRDAGFFAVVWSQNNAHLDLVAFDRHGHLDRGFGRDGYLRLDEIGYPMQGVMLDGSLLLVKDNLSTGRRDLDIRRLLPSGRIDSHFGAGGVVICSGNYGPLGFVELPDHQIIIAANFVPVQHEMNAGLIRIDSSVHFDATFGDHGFAHQSTDFWSWTTGSLIAQNDGKLLLSGYARREDYFQMMVLRFNTDGGIDTSFGNNGARVMAIESPNGGGGSFGNDIDLQNDGSIITAGTASLYPNEHCSNCASDFFVVSRLTESGEPDMTIASKGWTAIKVIDGE